MKYNRANGSTCTAALSTLILLKLLIFLKTIYFIFYTILNTQYTVLASTYQNIVLPNNCNYFNDQM